ncbi:MAG: hypothetical protein IJ773_09215 [Lachnospiraceae bacterium]|nr:hypothetical protein [Lachnospiraceae bacterium]
MKDEKLYLFQTLRCSNDVHILVTEFSEKPTEFSEFLSGFPFFATTYTNDPGRASGPGGGFCALQAASGSPRLFPGRENCWVCGFFCSGLRARTPAAGKEP